MIEILTFTLGPLGNNSYLAADPQTGSAVAVDPSFEPQAMIAAARQKSWQIEAIWLTHAHFDHIAGVAELQRAITPAPAAALHPGDLPLWREGGGARMFGFQLAPAPEPGLMLEHGQILKVGNQSAEVRHTPGHSPGHVVFVFQGEGVVLCGDLIFRRSVGRSDLPGSSSAQLAASIRAEIYTLPPATRLLCGHGPETTAGEEAAENPYV